MSNDSEDYVLETQDLTRYFGTLPAVRLVSLRVPRGCVFGLLGMNGSGKSTLIRMLAGHLRPHSGSLRILGLNPEEYHSNLRTRIGYVSEKRELYDWMTVAEKIQFTRSFYHNWDEHKRPDCCNGSRFIPKKPSGVCPAEIAPVFVCC